MSIPKHLIKTANPDELFDVVDTNDHIVSQATRGEVHARNLLHRAVHVLVHDATSRLFLQKRSRAKDTFPGCWDSSCSGHVDAGEDYTQAARRELGEELGYHEVGLPLRPLLKLNASPQTGHEFIQVFLLGPVSGPFELNPEEITGGKWIVPHNLDHLIVEDEYGFASALRHLWRNHRAQVLAGLGAN